MSLVKQCVRGHHWYIGRTCPLCGYLFGEEMPAIETEGGTIDMKGRGSSGRKIPKLNSSDDKSLEDDDCRYIN